MKGERVGAVILNSTRTHRAWEEGKQVCSDLIVARNITKCCVGSAPDLDLRPLTNKLGGRLDYDQPVCKASSDAMHMSERCASDSCKTFTVKMSPLHVGQRSQHAHAFTRRSVLRRNL